MHEFINLDNIIAKQKMKGHYFVTYSPQTRIYQVSRRPPQDAELEKTNVVTFKTNPV